MTVGSVAAVPQSTAQAASNTQKIEFEDYNRYASGNSIETSMSGYSGKGYLYLKSGWGEVGFTVSKSGNYTITIASNSDQYKENYLYLDNSSAGTLYTKGGSWQKDSYKVYLSKGTHKFGVSTGWGYVGLDYVLIAGVGSSSGSSSSGSSSGGSSGSGSSSSGGMYISGNQLYTSKGSSFVMRGINVAHAWYTSYTKESINTIADLGSNCVRVVLSDGATYTKTTSSQLSDIISLCKSRGLICIVEVHDHTGSDSSSAITSNAVNYWLEMKDILNANKDYVIVNIANEWMGTWNKGSEWASTYKSAIKSLRKSGLQNVLMIDAPGYGQEVSTCASYCKQVLSADTTGNTMFSIHMYSVAGANASTVKSNMNSMINTGVCFCVGEFGDYQNGADVDELTIMSYCTEKNIGYIAWSWKGNSGSDTTLDLSNSWSGKNLTNWGNEVFYTSGTGIAATAKSAY